MSMSFRLSPQLVLPHLLYFSAPETFTLNLDPHTGLADSEVQKLLGFKALANKLLDGFRDSARITRNPLPRVGQPSLSVLSHKDTISSLLPQAKKPRSNHHGEIFTFFDQSDLLPCSPSKVLLVMSFITNLINSSLDPLMLEAAKASPDWPQWYEAFQHEYASLRKHQVFGSLVTNLATKPVGHKLIFTKKRNAQGQVLRYKVRLIAQGFIQRPGVDYTFTYSPVMDSTTFQYLVGMAVQHSLETQLLDVVTAYLYGPLDADLHIKPPLNYLTQSIPTDSTHSFFGLKLRCPFYGLKQAGRMWYSHLHSFLLDHKFQYDQSLP